jgi:tellurite resistance protein TerC
MTLAEIAAVAALAVALLAFLLVDLRFFARDREPTFREGLVWSIGWLVLSLAAALVILPLRGEDDAVLYTTVYLVERSLSLDNLFVFIVLFAYFGIPVPQRARLLFWGIVIALCIRGLAIVAGIALIEQFHFVIYVLGATLLVLAYRLFRGTEENVDPGRSALVRAVRRVFPVAPRADDNRWFVKRGGVRHVTPVFLCLVAIVFADIAFAIDSIPAAFGITTDAFLIWMGNVFALLGLRALFVLVEGLIRRFRYLDETIAIVLGVVAVKLLLEDVYKLPAEASLALVLGILAGGILASLLAERREAREAAGQVGGPS